jgi:dTDP-glucose 4,6-dehydratase
MGRIVIAGGAGFLGSHLADVFVGRGDEVVLIDNLVTGDRANVAHLVGRADVAFIEADVSRGVVVDGPVSAVLNFASPASPKDYLALPIETLMVGSYGTQHLLELAQAKGARFLMASTSEVYGDPAIHPQPETYWGNVNPIGPRSVYDEAKRYSEALTMAYHRAREVDVRLLRIFNTYGPRMQADDGRVVSNFIVQALSGQPITIYGDGTQTRSFCYVADEVAGIVALLDGDQVGPVNIGNDGEFTMVELAELVLELTGSSSTIEHRPLPTDDPTQRKPDLTIARTQLGWEPTVSLRDGLVPTIDYFRQAISGR